MVQETNVRQKPYGTYPLRLCSLRSLLWRDAGDRGATGEEFAKDHVSVADSVRNAAGKYMEWNGDGKKRRIRRIRFTKKSFCDKKDCERLKLDCLVFGFERVG